MTATAQPPPTRRRRTPFGLLRLPFWLIRGVVRTVAAVLGGLAAALRWVADGRAKTVAAAIPPRATPTPPQPLPPLPPLPPAPAFAPLPAARSFAARPAAKPKAGATGQRVLFIAAIVGIVAIVLWVADDGSRRRVSAPPAPTSLQRLSPAKLQEHAADSAIVGAAAVALKAHPEPAPRVKDAPEVVEYVRIEPIPGVQAVPTLGFAVPESKPAPTPPYGSRYVTKPVKVRSESPHPTQQEAHLDALAVARVRLAEQLRQLDPPIHVEPSTSFVLQHVRPGSVTRVEPTDEQREEWKKLDLDPNQVWEEFELTGLTEEEVRHLRSAGRLTTTGRLVAVPFILAVALYGFLRIDAWMKGNLTVALGVGMAALAGGAVAMLALMR
jgi:hypothetical protein